MDKRPNRTSTYRSAPVRKLGVSDLSPFHRGLKDFFLGNITNPYEENTQDHRDWAFGFNKSYFANLEKINGKTEKVTP